MTRSLENLFSQNPRPLAILFDNDGVLIASEALHQRAWSKLFSELGLPDPEKEFSTLVGKTAPQILAILLDRFKPGWSSKNYDLERLSLRKNDHYLALLRTELEPYPGVREGLAWAKAQGIKTAVVSNAKRRELETAMDHLGLRASFDVLVSRDDAGASKPDPTPYLLAAASVGVEPSSCLAVEDSPTGLEAALLAGIPAAAVCTNFKKSELEAPVPGRPDLKPVWLGDSIAELFEKLKSLGS